MKKRWRLCNDSSEEDRSEINEESALVAAPNDYGLVIFRFMFLNVSLELKYLYTEASLEYETVDKVQKPHKTHIINLLAWCSIFKPKKTMAGGGDAIL